MLTSKLKAAKKFTAGYFILEQLEIRGWTLGSLARMMKIPAGEMDSLMDNSIPLSEEIAEKLGKVFKTSTGYWLNIEKGNRTWLSERKK